MNSPGVAETLLLSFAPAIKSVGESKEHAASKDFAQIQTPFL